MESDWKELIELLQSDGQEDFVKTKKVSGRAKDLFDLELFNETE